MNKQQRYLILNSGNKPLCLAEVESERGTPYLRLRIEEGQGLLVEPHAVVGLTWPEKQKPLAQYRVRKCSRTHVELEKLAFEDQNLKELLWVSVQCDSFLYLKKGRLPIRFVDMGCCAATFYGPDRLEEPEPEIVLPFSECPLVIRCRVLNQKKLEKGRALYAVEFMTLCEDEEKAITEAVFTLQRENRHNQIRI